MSGTAVSRGVNPILTAIPGLAGTYAWPQVVVNGGGQITKISALATYTSNITFSGTSVFSGPIVASAGGTLSNSLEINNSYEGGFGGGNGEPLFVNATTTGLTAGMGCATAGIGRWAIGKNQSLETGSNAGSDFGLYAYSDSGSYLGGPILVTRATGLVSIGAFSGGNSLTVSGTSTFGSITVSGTNGVAATINGAMVNNGLIAITGSVGGGFSGTAAVEVYYAGGGGIQSISSTTGTYSTLAFNATSYTFNIGASTNALLLGSGGSAQFPNVSTTASAANAFLNSSASNNLLRSTSSIRYKTDVWDMEESRADAVLKLRPVTFRSTCAIDDPFQRHVGLIAEEVAQVLPEIVHWHTKKNGEIIPESVQYDRLVVLLLDVIQRRLRGAE